MSTSSFLPQILAQLAGQLPVLLVSIAGLIAVSVRRPAGTAWAIAGFSLAAVLCLVAPVARTLVLGWATASNGGAAGTAQTFAMIGWVLSALHAASLGLLLTAVLAPRAAPAPR